MTAGHIQDIARIMIWLIVIVREQSVMTVKYIESIRSRMLIIQPKCIEERNTGFQTFQI